MEAAGRSRQGGRGARGRSCVAYHVGYYHRGIERRSEFQRGAVEKRRKGNGGCGTAAVSGPPAAGGQSEDKEEKDGGRRRRGRRKTLE